MKKYLCFLLLAISLSSCWNKDVRTMGYAPIYAPDNQIKTIVLTAPKTPENAGKIFVIGDYLFQVETGQGFHIMDISNPAEPKQSGFVTVTGCAEIAVKDGYIYTNNLQDLVVLSITEDKVNVIRRVPNAFETVMNNSRPPERGKFECPDPSKGTVIGWQKKKILNPACSY